MKNVVKVAIAAAGGTGAVSKLLGVNATTVSNWIGGRRALPPQYIRPICEAGGDIISRALLLEYVEAYATAQVERKAAAAAERAAASEAA